MMEDRGSFGTDHCPRPTSRERRSSSHARGHRRGRATLPTTPPLHEQKPPLPPLSLRPLQAEAHAEALRTCRSAATSSIPGCGYPPTMPRSLPCADVHKVTDREPLQDDAEILLSRHRDFTINTDKTSLRLRGASSGLHAGQDRDDDGVRATLQSSAVTAASTARTTPHPGSAPQSFLRGAGDLAPRARWKWKIQDAEQTLRSSGNGAAHLRGRRANMARIREIQHRANEQ